MPQRCSRRSRTIRARPAASAVPRARAARRGSARFPALTTVTATAKSTVNEVIVPGVSGDFSRDMVLQVDHAFRRWLIGTAKLGFGIDDYVALARVDQRWFASGALTYKLTRSMQLKAEIRHHWLNSTAPRVDYAADQFLRRQPRTWEPGRTPVRRREDAPQNESTLVPRIRSSCGGAQMTPPPALAEKRRSRGNFFPRRASSGVLTSPRTGRCTFPTRVFWSS